jgi:hypothetical protein
MEVIEVVVNMNINKTKITFCDIFKNLSMLNIRFRAGAVVAGVESRYCSGSGSTKIIRHVYSLKDDIANLQTGFVIFLFRETDKFDAIETLHWRRVGLI